MKWMPLCVFFLMGCALTPHKKIEFNPKVGDKVISVDRMWALVTRQGEFHFEGNRPQEMGGVTVQGDTLFFGNLDGRFFAVDRFSGKVLWKVQLPAGIEAKPLIENKTIYLGCNTGMLYALSIHGGRELWKLDIGAEVVGEPSYWKGFLIVHTITGRIIAMDGGTGKRIWEVRRPLIKEKSIRGVSKPVIQSEKVYVGTLDGFLLVLNVHDGSKIWEKSLTPSYRFTDIDNTPIIFGNKVLISAFDGKTYALREKDGAILWAYPEGAAFDSEMVEGVLIMSTQRSTVDAIDAQTGKQVWSTVFDPREGIATGVTVNRGLVAFGTMSGKSYMVSLKDGHYVWSFRPGSGMTSNPILHGSNLYLFSNYGNLYAFAVR